MRSCSCCWSRADHRGRIGERLGLSAAGVRRHLDALIDAGEAESVPAAAWQQMGRGRPAKRYRLTAAGRETLEHAYDDLASAAMHQLREIGGDEAVRTFARRRIDTILSGFSRQQPCRRRRRGDRRADRHCADQSGLRGHDHASRWADPRRADLPASLPVSHVAEEFPEFCETEQQAMAEVLGTHVQRLATIVNGDCACTTHVPLTPISTTPLRRTAHVEATTSKQGASR
ncbi:hypothetical protein I553_10003 [Mycobacterium xenopi 4042]|uniref:Transcriptional regulator n=1 Tax=Mycobacterium xenopi 4042 TaxID=1299334 RepID=X7YQ76_MYCXE|nr:hypothetical protein I553_10003 [Mycobacterium xenopi 4042]